VHRYAVDMASVGAGTASHTCFRFHFRNEVTRMRGIFAVFANMRQHMAATAAAMAYKGRIIQDIVTIMNQAEFLRFIEHSQ
jgi:hypothetical protein